MRFLPLFFVVLVVACSSSTRSLFFDIPPPSEEEILIEQYQRQQALLAARGGSDAGAAATAEDQGERPAVEAVLDWETAQAQLPAHPKGGVDWTEALAQGLVRPRTGADPDARYAAAFKYDFVIEGQKEKFNAWFPHSAHTAWLGCQNCHGELYPLRRNPASMKEMRSGASCGACHGKVAFSLKECKLCHTNM